MVICVKHATKSNRWSTREVFNWSFGRGNNSVKVVLRDRLKLKYMRKRDVISENRFLSRMRVIVMT